MIRFSSFRAMAEEKRTVCTLCDAQGPSIRRAKWLIEPDMKLVYFETQEDDNLSDALGPGQFIHLSCRS